MIQKQNELQKLKYDPKLPIKSTFKKEEIFIESKLQSGEHAYLTLNKMFDIEFDLNLNNEKIWIFFKGESTTALYGYCMFYDENGEEVIFNQGKTWICCIWDDYADCMEWR